MSVFDEILCNLNEISNNYVRTLNDDIKVAFDCLDKFAEGYKNGRGLKDQSQKKALVNTLMSINEDEDENSPKDVRKSKDGTEKRLSNKRSKAQVEGMSSPEQEKRPKRSASVKAQNNIAKQVNVSLTQKLRRDDTDKSRRRKDDDKENALPIVQVKLEKLSLPPEPMETEAAMEVPAVPVKQEPSRDEATMPPPAAPVPRPRRLPPKEKSTDSSDEAPGKRRTRTRNKDAAPAPPESVRSPKEKSTDSSDEAPGERRTRTRNADAAPAPPAPARVERAARASRRGTGPGAAAAPPPPGPRPKRTRAKKKVSEAPTTDTENTQPPLENGIGSPADKPRPKRTRRGKNAAEKEETLKPKEPTPEPEIIIPKQERISVPAIQSPAIPQKTVRNTKTNTTISSDDSIQSKKGSKKKAAKSKVQEAISLEETQVISHMNTTVTISMDKTVVLTNGVYDHEDGKAAIAMNETVVLDKINRDTMVLDKPQAKILDSTVVIEKDAAANLTDDLSLLTDDSEQGRSPPEDDKQPSSAVKAKVQQFEEMAARTTRTKTRAMAKKDTVTENSTPPDKMIPKHVLSADTLSKMNSMIFNGKTPQISSSASKPVAKLPPLKPTPLSASKARDEQSRDDARRKKEAILEAKKEMQKRKREEKMAAAAAAREAADRERRAALQAQAKDRMEKQAHADQGKLERIKEAERKKQELARKVAETEERRRAEEQARLARLADDQRKADAARRKQQEDSEAMKKEAAMMAKEIEKRQKEYLEKQKMKQRMEDKLHTPLRSGKPAMEPAYMADGFQHLNSDDDDDDDAPPKVPTPAWCKARHRQLALQQLLAAALVDRLFSVRAHSVDLRGMFPGVERAALKRTSSAVWRTPPPRNLSRVHESPV